MIDWKKFEGASCLPDCWCELPRHGSLILEPFNSWSNLGFIILGIYILLFSTQTLSNQNIIINHPILEKFYSFILIFLGIGSFLFHMSQTFIGQWIDVLGMYLLISYFFLYNFLRIRKLSFNSFYVSYFIINIIFGFLLYYQPQTRRYLFAVLVILTLIQSVWVQLKIKSLIEKKYLLFSIGYLILGQVFWNLDKSKIWCNPTGMINGHGIWHLLCSMAAFYAFKYFKSESKI